MKAYPIVLAAAVVGILVRIGLLRRRRSGSAGTSTAERRGPRAISPAPRRGSGNPLGKVGLVALREMRERLRSRIFRVVTLLLLMVVAAAVVIPTIHSRSTKVPRIGVVGTSTSFDAELGELAHSVGLSVRIVHEANLTSSSAALDSGGLDAVVTDTRILVKNPVPETDASASARFVRTVSLVLGAQRAFVHAGLTPAQAAAVLKAKPLPVVSMHPGKKARTPEEATALLGVILIFVVLTQYLTWTLIGVMEEKANRVVEVLLATVRPVQLLAGKVIGIGTVALAQAIALAALALVLAKAVGSNLVHGTSPLIVGASLVWLVIGYAFYSWLYAAAGSTAERQDQVQSLALPISAPLIFGYIVSITGVSSGDPSLLVKVLAYLPPTAPFAMPTLVGFGEARWWQFLLSAAVSLVCTVLGALVAAKVYRTAVLKTGRRVRLRELVPAKAG